ncbi:MAG: ABC transporter permease, partial [Chloroflexi bacterium]|nr:ABC transporter permease [Chloroflexota bacterium]
VFHFAVFIAFSVLVFSLIVLIISLVAATDLPLFLSSLLSDEVRFAICLSLITATISTTFAIVMAIPTAYVVSQYRFPGKDIVDSLLDLPIVLSPVALGAALLIFFNTPIGGFIDKHVIRFSFAVAGVVLAQVAVVTALAIRLLKSTFDSIDPRYEHVSRTLGCNKFRAFIKVTLPLARNGLISASILTWARAVGEFGATVMLAGATFMKTETLPIAIALC